MEFYDNLFRVLVRSESDPTKQYLCDVEAYAGIGWCGCQHFEARLHGAICELPPALRSQEHIQRQYRCKHLRAARAWIGQWLLNRTIELRSKVKTPRRYEKY